MKVTVLEASLTPPPKVACLLPSVTAKSFLTLARSRALLLIYTEPSYLLACSLSSPLEFELREGTNEVCLIPSIQHTAQHIASAQEVLLMTGTLGYLGGGGGGGAVTCPSLTLIFFGCETGKLA